jgi:hypothetical protein
VSELVSRSREAGQRGRDAEQHGREAGQHGRGRWAALGIVVVLVAGTVSAWQAGAFSAAA